MEKGGLGFGWIIGLFGTWWKMVDHKDTWKKADSDLGGL